MKCANVSEVALYVAGELGPERKVALETHLDGCEACSRVHEELGAVAGSLAPEPAEFADPKLAGDVMTLIRLGQADRDRTPVVRPRNRWLWWLAPAAVAVAAAALLVVVWPTGGTDPTSGFQPRSSGGTNPDRWVSLRVFRALPSGYEEIVGGPIAQDDALAFAYEDRSRPRFGYLMVFAVDARGEVFWYYPIHTSDLANPRSIATVAGAEPIELPNEIVHDLALGPLRIFALFSRRPLDVDDVEAQVGRELGHVRGVEALERLESTDIGQHSLLLFVGPPARKRGE